MKWAARDLTAALAKPPEALPPLLLIFGDDAGTIRQLSSKVCAHVSPNPDDPFSTDRLGLDDLHDSPGALRDAAGTVSFGGGLRLVRVDGAFGNADKNQLDKLNKAVAILLEEPPAGSVVVLPVPGLEAKHGLAMRVTKHKQAAAVRCYHDSARDLATLVGAYFREVNRRVEPDALAFLRDNLGNDREITMRELEKLDMYTTGQQAVTLADCLACIAAAPSVSVFKLTDAIGSRDVKQVETTLRLLAEEGEEPNMVLALVVRHLKRLQQARAHMNEGLSPDEAMRRLRPPVAFGKAEFAAQLRTYPPARLARMAERALALQLELRSGTLPPQLALHRALLGLSA